MAKSYSSIKPFKVGNTFEDENKPKKSYKDIKASEYDFGVDDEYIKSYLDDIAKYSSEAEKDYNGITFGSDVSGLYDKHFSQTSSLRERGATIRAYLNSQKSNIDEDTYNEFIKALDSHDTFTADTSKAFQQRKDFYTTFKTQYDYDAYVLNNTGDTDSNSISARKKAYDSITARLAEIDKELTGYTGISFIDNILSDYDTSGKQELVKERDKLQAELTKYDRGKKTTDELYTQYSSNEDWETDSANRDFNKPTEIDVSRYGSVDIDTGEMYDIDESVVTMEDPLGTYMSFFNGDDGYQYGIVQYVGVDPELEEQMHVTQHAFAYNDAIQMGQDQHWELLEEEEVNLYYYMLSNDMKEQALSYLAGMETELDRRSTVEYQKELENASALELVFHNVVSIPANIIGGATAFVGDAFDLMLGNEINPYEGGHAIQNYAQGVRTATANDINKATGASEDDWITWGDAYQGLMSAADSVAGAAVFGSGYTVLMGMGGAASEAKELYEAGASKGQIIAGGLLAGAAEAAFEKISVGYFLDDVLGKPAKHIGQWLYKTLGMAGVEATEEFCTTIANYISDAAVRGNTSDWAAMIDKYTKAGYSNGEAIWRAIKEVGGEALHDGVIGAISGGGMGAIGNTVSALQYDSAAKSYGKQIIDAGGVDTLNKLSLDMAGEMQGISNFADKLALKKYANKASKADLTTKKGAKAVGVLADTVDTVKSKLNKGDIKSALIKKGLSKDKAENYANILVAMNEEYFNGNDSSFTLGTDEQWQKMTGDKNAYSVLSEIVTDKNSAVNIRNLAVGNAKRGIRVDAEGNLDETDVAAYQERQTTKMIQAIAEANGLQQDVETDLDVSEDGKVYADTDNGTVEVTSKEFVDSEDGTLKVKVNGEQEVDTSSVSYGNVGEALVVSAIVDMGVGAEDANALYNMFKGVDEKAGQAFAKGISLAFKYGRYFYSPSKLSGIVGISKEQAKEAFRIGRESRSKDTKASQAQLNATAEENAKEGKKVSSKGSVVYEGTIADENGNLAAGEGSLTDIQKASVNGLKLIAELSPLNFHLFQSEKDGDTYTYVKKNGEETHANGWYRVGTNDIYIDLNAGITGEGTVMYTAAHEISHFIKQYSPEKWDKIAEYIMSEYCAHYGGKVDALLLKHITAIKARPDADTKTQKEIEDEAFEDLVCDSLSRMLIDGTVVEAMANIKKKDKGVWNAIKNAVLKLLDKWGVVIDQYKGRNPDAEEAGYFRETSKAFKKLQGMLTEAFVDAGDTYSKVGNLKTEQNEVLSDRATAEESKAIKSLGKGATVERNENGDMLVATNKDGSTVMYSERTWRMGGKEKFIATMKSLGHGEQAQEYAKYLDDALGYLHELAVGYEILGQHLDADIVTDIKNGKQVLSAIVNNGEYPVNIDLALICKKRVAYMRLMAKMIEDGVFGDVKYDGDAIAEVNKILRKNGFETACLGCFVESRRLQFQTWAETIVQEWNEAVEARNKYAHYFRFADGKASLTDEEIEALDKELASGGKKNDKGNLNLGQGSVSAKMSRLLDKVPSLARKLTVDDLLTPQGLTALRATDSNLFSLVKQRYGAASPKIVQDYNPYASEIADLTFNFVKKVTGNNVKGAQDYINQAKKELGDAPKKLKSESKEDFKKRKEEYDAKAEALAMQKYLYSIGGARIQSFSDFMIENVFDYLQIFADLAAKELPMHGYTKEVVALRLFGMSGAKWNGSLIAHVEKSMGKEYAGLLPASEAKNGNGIPVKVDGKDYCIAFDDYARNKATNGESFIQSIGMKDIVALMYDPRYSPYVGNITIGVSDKQIMAMLDSPLFRMVIPYHASGMLPQFAQLVCVDMYNDYTNYQNTTVREIRLLNDTDYTVKIGDNGKPKVVKKADSKDVGINTHYAFNEKLQKYGDARKTCQDYLAWCKNEHPIYDKGKVIGFATFNAKFSDSPTGVDFTKHRNYYKLIEDFNTYDNITEKASQQGAVTMNFPSAENRLTAEQKSAYEKALRDTGIFTEADIKKYLKKADMTFEEIVREEVGNRKAYNDATEHKFESTVKEVEDYLLNAKDDKGNYKFRRDSIADTASDYIEAKNHGISLKPATGSYMDEITKLGADYGVDKLSDRRTIRKFDHSADAIARNVEAVAGMDSVHDVPASALEDSGKPINQIYQDFFDEWGGELFSEELGVIDVKPSSIRSEKRHGSTAQKIASIEAIPTVVNEGKVIFANYKSGTDVLRIVVAAPITIDGKPYYMGVMVQRDSKFQRLYLHDVVIEEETPDFSQVDLLTTGTDEKNERLFVTTILQQALKVKYENRNELKVKDKLSDHRFIEGGAVEQKISSAKTSIKQIPALFKDKNVVFGKTNIDVGGGKFDLATDFLAERGTKNYVFDPYNRSEEVNSNTLAFLQSGNKADTATCANVLNVIAESGARANVILEVAKSIKDDGTAYFMVYEGDSSGNGRETSAGWQNNRKTADYIQEISQYFNSVERKGKLIIAKNPAKNLPMATWEISPGKGIRFSDRTKAPTFYSQMAKVVDGIKQDKVGANEALNIIKKGKGVRAEEIKWSGIETWLEGKKSVTKAELQEFIAGSQLQIDEVTLDNKDRPYTDDQQKRLDEYESKRDEVAKRLADEWKKVTGDEFPIRNAGAGLESAVANAIIDANLAKKNASFEGRLLKKLRKDLYEVIERYDDFGFDSAKDALRSIHRHRRDFISYYDMDASDKAVIVKYCNALNAYNELPNSISDEDTDKLRAIALEADPWNRKIMEVKHEHNEEEAKYMTKWGQYRLEGGKNYREVLFRIPDSTYSNSAMYAHWGERRGVLAHARIQDFVDADGNKMLFIEELQSDWHNEGHKSGYRDSGVEDKHTLSKKMEKFREEFFESPIAKMFEEKISAVGYEGAGVSMMLNYLLDETDYTLDVLRRKGVSFTDSEKSGIDKYVREYGELQNQWESAPGDLTAPDAPFRDNYHEYVLKRLIRMVAEDGYDSIGWTTADTQMDRWNPQRKTNREMGIEDAKNPDAIAFEKGYGIEYDQDIPKFLRKYGEKWGATVGSTTISGGTDVWSMPITDSMKDSVLYEGQVLYQDRNSNSVSSRALLANALETTIDSSTPEGQIELKKLKEYKEMIGTLDELSHKLTDLRNALFSKGITGEERKKIQEEATKTANRISVYDKKLLTLEASKPLKKVLDREKALAVKRQKAIDAENFAAYKKESEAKLRRQAEYYQESREKAVERVKETRAKNEAKAKLQKLVLETAKWISYPKKGDVKCPDILRAPYADFLKGIDFSSKTLLEKGEQTKNDMRMTMAMDSLATAVERIQTAQNPETENAEALDIGYLDLPPNFVKMLREMAEKVKGMMINGDYVVNQMTSVDIKQLTKLIRTLNHSIKEMSTLYSNLRFARVEDLGDNSISFMEGIGDVDSTSAVGDFFAWDNALPYYAFKRFGAGGESVFEELMDAQDKMAFLAQGIMEFREKAWDGNEAKAWSEDTHTIELPSGKEIILTTADAMSIYCLYRRDNNQGLNHLVGGGVRVIGAKDGAKQAKDSKVELDIDDVLAICDSLDDRPKAVAEAIQEYMSTVCSEWGNEISMKRFLTKDFVEKRYFPIQSNDEVLAVRDPQAQQSDLYRLLNISATKPLTPNANNSVIIRNIFDVFTEHASDMARLNAYGMALLDYMKWVNYNEKTKNEKGQIKIRGVRSAMNNAYGEKAQSYIVGLIKDINGRFNDGGDHPFLMKMTRYAKTASVGANLRVAALQFTAYPRASMVLSAANLVKGLSKKPQISKAKQYCGIALWKSFGFYDTNIARSIEDQIKGTTDWKQKLIELSLKGAEWGDAITWGYLWNACEYDVATSNKQLKVGTEEFNQAVAKRLREVVYSTQVVDSVLTRSDMMRKKSGLTQTATAFMSEPTLTANILMDAGFQFYLEKRRTGSAKAAWAKTGKHIMKTATVFGATSVIIAVVESLADAYRDDDEEEFIAKFGEAMLKNSVSNLLIFNKIPIVADVMEGLLSLVGLGYFSTDRLDTVWLSDIVKAVETWIKVLGEEFGVKNTSFTVYKALYDTVKAFSSSTGIPVSGLLREIITLWNNTAGAANPDLKVKKYDD